MHCTRLPPVLLWCNVLEEGKTGGIVNAQPKPLQNFLKVAGKKVQNLIVSIHSINFFQTTSFFKLDWQMPKKDFFFIKLTFKFAK